MKQSDPSLKAYLNEVGKYPLLGADEELALGRLVQRLVELEEKLGSGQILGIEEEIEVFNGQKAKKKFNELLQQAKANYKKYKEGDDDDDEYDDDEEDDDILTRLGL